LTGTVASSASPVLVNGVMVLKWGNLRDNTLFIGSYPFYGEFGFLFKGPRCADPRHRNNGTRGVISRDEDSVAL
jgi:hypothetical protein